MRIVWMIETVEFKQVIPKLYAKHISVCVRLSPEIAHNKIFGFDAAEWIRLDLVDIIVPTSRWKCTDSTMDISEWKELTKGTQVEIWAELEWQLKEPVIQSVETMKGFAAQYLDTGADKIYLYNWFRACAQDMQESDFQTKENYELYLEAVKKDVLLRDMWDVCSTRENCHKGIRRHVMTFREAELIPKGIEKKVEKWHPLPVKISGQKTMYLETGDCSNRKVTLFVGVKSGDVIPSIDTDGTHAQYLGPTRDAYVCHGVMRKELENPYEDMDFYAYETTVGTGCSREIILNGDNITLQYLEMKVE